MELVEFRTAEVKQGQELIIVLFNSEIMRDIIIKIMQGMRWISWVSGLAPKEKPLALPPGALRSCPFLCPDLTSEMPILLCKSNVK